MNCTGMHHGKLHKKISVSCLNTKHRSVGHSSGMQTSGEPHNQVCTTLRLQDNYRTTTGQLHDICRTPTGHNRVSVFLNFMSKRIAHVESKNVEFLFCNFGIACTCCVGVVWCEGNRVNHRTSTGQVQDKYRTTIGQLQDNFRTTTGHLQDTHMTHITHTGTVVGRVPANMQHDYTECRVCSIWCRKEGLTENNDVEFIFCN